ncbi:MAG: Unknown protein [uncultured Sulfurovum sp.]|uniref:Uncharacterized protein n=1 Tax=uncultured Sulfurovum sp. TaxID=269237 RepID=A0A6S6TH93_9BACT|nr:MAG: Unknown protein [uncultured Sulfurovum sp.]
MEMDIEEIKFELELTGLSIGQITKLINAVKRDGFDPKQMDRKLIAMGYSPIFTIYDDYEDNAK